MDLPNNQPANSSIQLAWPGGPLRGTLHLPASKSESNRALILQALAGGGTLTNLSDAHDTMLMQRLLAQPEAEVCDAEDAGTVMRFLTAHLAMGGRTVILTGTARMQQRPIGVLVDALRQLGARIAYTKAEGFPPLHLLGRTPLPATDSEPIELDVRGDISSQYISALLMIGPMLANGLRIRLLGKVGSRPYIRLTLSLMQHFGANCRDLGTVLDVRPQPYHAADYQIEADWSAASYAYALVALAPPGSWLLLPGLRRHSWQGDQAIVAMMEKLGVQTEFLADETIRLSQGARADELIQDFTHCPDLAQTIAVVAAALGIPATFTGLESLRIKETDRIGALQVESKKFGATLTETEPERFSLTAMTSPLAGQTVATYHDHRMALAFAPLTLRAPITIEAPGVVRKSFPRFWEELRQLGFAVTEAAGDKRPTATADSRTS